MSTGESKEILPFITSPTRSPLFFLIKTEASTVVMQINIEINIRKRRERDLFVVRMFGPSYWTAKPVSDTPLSGTKFDRIFSIFGDLIAALVKTAIFLVISGFFTRHLM